MSEENDGLKPHGWKVVSGAQVGYAMKLYYCDGCNTHVWHDWVEELWRETLSRVGISEDCNEALVRNVLSV